MPGLASIVDPYDIAVRALLDQSSAKVSDADVQRQLLPNKTKNAAALETSFRNCFYEILSSQGIDDTKPRSVWRLLDIVNIACDAELCEPQLIFGLIEELLDSQTIQGCSKVFDYLESHQERLISRHWKAKNLVVLRSCNELLKRLSRAEDTVFCGRVFVFLFQSFPLGDRSSVNLRGEYHTDNVTQYDRTASKVRDPEGMDVDGDIDTKPEDVAAAAPAIKVEGNDTIDADALYPIFWSLQEYFAQPTKLFDAPSLQSFKSGLELTLKKFKEVYREEPRSTSRAAEDSNSTKRMSDEIDGSNFNPKYLTSRDLFELEISDPAFRRHILVQALIVADFLLSQEAKAKSRLQDLKNKSVIYDFVLDEKDVKWATDMRNDIAGYLQQGPEGKFYYRMVDTVLSRDKNWLRWKAESCPPFQLDPVAPENYSEAKENVVKAAAPRQIRKAPLGALDLSFLDEQEGEDPLFQYRDLSRWKLPELKSFKGAIMAAELDIDMARTDEEIQAAKEAKSNLIWRALRIGGRFSILDKLDDGNNLDPLFGIAPKEEDIQAGNEEAKVEGAGYTSLQLDGAADERNPETHSEAEGQSTSGQEMQVNMETDVTDTEPVATGEAANDIADMKERVKAEGTEVKPEDETPGMDLG